MPVKKASLIFVIALLFFFVAPVNASIFPIAIRLVQRPATFQVGREYAITVELKNTSDRSVTLSNLYSFNWGLSWTYPDGCGAGTISGPGSKHIIGTNYDPETGKFTCKHLDYEKSDFITLLPHSSQRFDIIVSVPQNCTTSTADLELSFESKYDGSQVGLKALVGKTRTLTATLHIKRP